MKIGYARVSTLEQSLDLQLDALRAAGCDQVYTDKISGAKDARPGLDAALDHLRPRDVLVVWKLDRLGRSPIHLLTLVKELGDRGIDFASITDAGMDTTTPTGRFMFMVAAALAQLERDRTIERVQAGLTAARARGRRGGRKLRATPAVVAEAQRLYDSRALTVAQIGRTVGLARTTLYRVLRTGT